MRNMVLIAQFRIKDAVTGPLAVCRLLSCLGPVAADPFQIVNKAAELPLDVDLLGAPQRGSVFAFYL